MATLSPPVSPHMSPGSNSGRPERPRVTSTLSYMSNRSRRSSGSANKLDLTESARDKRRLEGKSDPTKALHEAQPAAVAMENSNLEDIRMMQHRDMEGNVITDPDRSNPTRSRMERPLDTIRSFNAAADGTSFRRSSYQSRPSSQVGIYDGQQRRGSYYNQPSPYSPQGRPRQGYGGYYRNNSYGFRTDSFTEEGPQSQQPPMPRPMRHQSAPFYPQAESPTSSHSQQHSYETMTSGSDELGKSTNPSSQNSSFDQLQQAAMRKADPYNPAYDQENVNPQGRSYYQQAVRQGGYGQQQQQQYQQPQQQGQQYQQPYQDRQYPPSAMHNGSSQGAYPSQRGPIRLNNGSSGPPAMSDRYDRPSPPQKRQSWLKRTFSRK